MNLTPLPCVVMHWLCGAKALLRRAKHSKPLLMLRKPLLMLRKALPGSQVVVTQPTPLVVITTIRGWPWFCHYYYCLPSAYQAIVVITTRPVLRSRVAIPSLKPRKTRCLASSSGR
uniref:Uncharacterized protein n=1 Tax=Volvariella volvacea TaxID=36659 RepID=A0A5H2QBC7_9AGAR|nr:hypothetical protein [Volvariella volvacea]